MSRNTGSVASSDKSWLKLYAAVAALPLFLAACGGGGGGGDSSNPQTPTPSPAPTPAPTPAPAPGPAPQSTIGTNWNNVSVGGAGNLTAVDYDDGVFVAVSDTGTALTSADGSSWTGVTPLTSNVATDHLTANAVGHLGSTLYAVGSISPAPYTTSTGALATSTDGTTWTMATLPAGTTPLHGVMGGNGLVVALGEAGHVYTSSDGKAWTAVDTLKGGVGTLTAGAYANGAYVAVGNDGWIAQSFDGNIWGASHLFVVNGVGINFHAITWTGAQFVAVGDNGAITTSTNGSKWTPLATSAVSGTLRSVAAASNGTIVVVGDNGIETSTDGGNTWKAQNENGAAALTGVAYGNATFVAVGSAGAIKTSTN